jgi:peptide/nickel transport system permease protein
MTSHSGRAALRTLRRLLLLLFTVATALFFLLRVAGDPAEIIAGPEATPEQIAATRTEFGLDRPLPLQYLAYLGNVAQLDFGRSIANGRPALTVIFEALPATLLLASLAMLLTILIAVPFGLWLGAAPGTAGRRAGNALIFVLQGSPGFVVGLLLVQWLSIENGWLPSLGLEGLSSWILPSLTLASFLTPKLTRVVAANVTEAMSSDYVRTARAVGTPDSRVLWQHVLPNALTGALALIGTQFAFLISGSVIAESIFAWPGVGLLLIDSARTLDFPVLQALALVVALLVFACNALIDLAVRALDPRQRARSVAASDGA